MSMCQRESLLVEVQNQTGLDREMAKKAFIICLHCGSYQKNCTEGQDVDLLTDFSEEIKQGISEAEAA